MADRPIESLESRLLLSATVMMRKGRLIITGDDNPTKVVVESSPNRRLVQVLIDDVLVDPNPRAGPFEGVKRTRVHRVLVTTGAGNDNIRIGLLDVVPHRQRRGLVVGRAIVFAGAGDDTIQGGSQGDVLIGGAGNDTLFGADNNDLLFGGTGDDTLSGNFRRDNLFGQDGNDTLNGDQGDDALYGMNGDDTLTGGVDTDFLNGGPGNNTLVDGNNEPDLGERHNVPTYMKRLVHLAVPRRFRQSVFT